MFGLVVIWLFDLEFTDRTAKDLLALATSRGAVVGAKLLFAAGWRLLPAAQLVVISPSARDLARPARLVRRHRFTGRGTVLARHCSPSRWRQATVAASVATVIWWEHADHDR